MGCGTEAKLERGQTMSKSSIAPAKSPCHFCGAVLAPHGVTRREGALIVWYAACVECKRKEER